MVTVSNKKGQRRITIELTDSTQHFFKYKRPLGEMQLKSIIRGDFQLQNPHLKILKSITIGLTRYTKQSKNQGLFLESAENGSCRVNLHPEIWRDKFRKRGNQELLTWGRSY